MIRAQRQAVAVDDLRVELLDGTPVIADIDLHLESGEVLGVVGESGCGKTTTAMALLGYARPGSRIVAGRVEVAGHERFRALGDTDLRRLRGRSVSYVPQDPSTALNPGMRIGPQVEEMLLGRDESASERRSRAGGARAGGATGR